MPLPEVPKLFCIHNHGWCVQSQPYCRRAVSLPYGRAIRPHVHHEHVLQDNRPGLLCWSLQGLTATVLEKGQWAYAMLKRDCYDTYHKMSEKHLARYIQRVCRQTQRPRR